MRVQYFTEPKKNKKDKEDNKFKSFSKKFQELYVNANPKDKSVNNGAGREPMKHDALNRHMKKIEGPVEYSFQSVKDENGNDIKGQYQVIATPRQDETNT